MSAVSGCCVTRPTYTFGADATTAMLRDCRPSPIPIPPTDPGQHAQCDVPGGRRVPRESAKCVLAHRRCVVRVRGGRAVPASGRGFCAATVSRSGTCCTVAGGPAAWTRRSTRPAWWPTTSRRSSPHTPRSSGLFQRRCRTAQLRAAGAYRRRGELPAVAVDQPRADDELHRQAGGLAGRHRVMTPAAVRPAHGRAASIWWLSDSRVASSEGRPTSCSDSGQARGVEPPRDDRGRLARRIEDRVERHPAGHQRQRADPTAVLVLPDPGRTQSGSGVIRTSTSSKIEPTRAASVGSAARILAS